MATVLPLWSEWDASSSNAFKIANCSAWLFEQELCSLYLPCLLNAWFTYMAAPAPTLPSILLSSVDHCRVWCWITCFYYVHSPRGMSPLLNWQWCVTVIFCSYDVMLYFVQSCFLLNYNSYGWNSSHHTRGFERNGSVCLRHFDIYHSLYFL